MEDRDIQVSTEHLNWGDALPPTIPWLDMVAQARSLGLKPVVCEADIARLKQIYSDEELEQFDFTSYEADVKFVEAMDTLHDTQKLMAATCAFVFNGDEKDVYRANGIADAFVASLFVKLGREETRKVLSRMSEQLEMFRSD